MTIKIGLLGLGVVGTGVAKIILDPSGRNSLLNEISIVKIGVRSLDKSRQIDLPPNIIGTDLESIVNDPDIDIIVELLGGLEPARTLILKAITNKKHIVTANKAVMALHGDEIYKEAYIAGINVLSEATVGGGIPIVKALKQSLGANRIESIVGIINGTTNYILTKMASTDTEFETVLMEAQALGYAESDPSADIDGLDAADKIAILASLGFGIQINRNDIYYEGIRGINSIDIKYAKQLGFVIKLLAIVKKVENNTSKKLQLRVHPTLVPREHPLAHVNGVYNAVLVEGNPLGEVMFFGEGAGSGPTASAVVSDIINIADALKKNTIIDSISPSPHRINNNSYEITSIESIKTPFYVRFLSKDLPGVIGHLGTMFGKYNVSLKSVVQIGFQGNLAEIVVITHHVDEGSFRTALNKMCTLEAIDCIPSVLRVL
ncbi:MAG: homoserine dehydrogenase [Candidatus Atelocyanobacterium thalassa isolate SIO64986]|uniref:Homoserine dehydrogenase n=1 Tax=Candidatus Atelocyanobacterium thalassa isolate SIO64986 TaxID=1527444 RepID=A0A086CIK3_9CHRO|nr:MAG: homoserine dehydrogenase [Candidatus Atelocyanobacterium thalassa isolate SIO64986]